jgi:hypothetical protein
VLANIVGGNMSTDPPDPRSAPAPLWLRLLRTVAVLAFFALTFTSLLKFSNASLERRDAMAGFPMGVLHGICMPASLPHLLLGYDVPIFAASNTGRTYKLGLTVGINSAGLVFFGSFYWRFHRLRKALAAYNAGQGTSSPAK